MTIALPAANLLASETSPYLRQHDANPVHWRPWGPAALAEASSTARPILLSIGYAACHWCHVMAHESFENAAVADVMNRLFVNIKVDREERPEIDQVYMASLSAMGEQGGWPLTMFLTPDALPFWGGTYFPPEPRYGRPGFVQVLHAVHDAWQTKRTDILQNARALSTHVGQRLAASTPPQSVTRESLRTLGSAIFGMIDPVKGGLKGAPKFPNAPMMQTLWLAALDGGDHGMRDVVVQSYRQMLRGGIYDHVGGGLARYSTDAAWNVPHFEKMLYDNAQLIKGLVYAHSATADALFRQRLEETVTWLLRDLRSADGAFMSSYDADSEGEEGRFYTWTEEQAADVLGDDVHHLFATHELVSPANWEGDPILRMRAAAEPSPVCRALLDRLLEARRPRVAPGLDAKILVDWNGLAISALALAGRSFERTDWLNAAIAAYEHIVAAADAGGRLPHSLLGERRQYPALSSDYAAMITAAVELAQATNNGKYLIDARAFADLLDKWHLDGEGTGYFLSSADAADVPLRIRGDVDEAIPSATGQIIEALVRLSSATGDEALRAKTWRMAEHANGRAQQQQYGQSGIINAAALARDPWKLVIVDAPEDSRLISVANRMPDPRRVDIYLPLGAATSAVLPGQGMVPTGKVAAYLCKGQACLPPMHDPDDLERALRTPGTS